ncbi:MAG: adenylate/guanylate cyclase domain-containing protein [Flavobacteriales bacterium]
MAQPQRDSLLAITRNAKADEATRLQATADLYLRNWIAPHQDTVMALAQQMEASNENNRLAYYGCLVAGALWSQRHVGDRIQSTFERAKELIPDTANRRDRAWLYKLQANAAVERQETNEAITSSKAGLMIARTLNDKGMETQFLLLNDFILDNSGEFVEGMEYLTKARKICEETGDSLSLFTVYQGLGSVLGMVGDQDASEEYAAKAFELSKRLGRHDMIASAYLNMSHPVANTDLDLGIAYTDSAIAHTLAIGDLSTARIGYSMKSRLQQFAGRNEAALASLDEAIAISPDYPTENITAFLGVSRSTLLRNMGRTKEALALSRELYDRHRHSRDVNVRMWVVSSLSYAEEVMGNHRDALELYKSFIHIQDSVETEENKRGVIRKEYQYTYEKQALADSLQHASELAVQAEEVRRQKVVRNGFMGGFALVALFAGIFLTQRNRIGKEKARSEELLLNILPEEVADELKAKGEAEARSIDQVTVLFTDFKGFTSMSEKLSPKELVKDLHECFSAFDRICEKNGLEKIKTIGDAYMAAGGLPTPNTSHATDVINAALEIRDFIAEGKAHKIAAGLPYFEIRIGVHTGPVVAGIVGVKKFQYDIWGDTVNTAARMESSGEVGQVNISEATYRSVAELSVVGASVAQVGAQASRDSSTNSQQPTNQSAPRFTFTSRGKVQAKGKGELEMYFVQRSDEVA